jgi:small subunit ribosomal protein S29e
MTASDWKKVYKQIRHKPAKAAKFLKHNKPKERTSGKAKRRCERTGQFGGHIKQYGINMTRQAFREVAEEIGFHKYS